MIEPFQLKQCKICKENKSTENFNKAGEWFQPYCKPCDSDRKKKYYEKNKEKTRVRHKEYYNKNSIRIKEKVNEYRIIEAEKVSIRKKKYYRENKEKREVWRKDYELKNKRRLSDRRKEKRIFRKEKIRDYNRFKCSTDVEFRLLKNIRNRIRWALKNANTCKSLKTEIVLGCTMPFYKEYFCGLFTDGMTWELFMKGKIHIDHIRPCKLFDLNSEEQQKLCFNYLNTQPLWAIENMKKGIKYKEVA